jgi:hypothetical protein
MSKDLYTISVLVPYHTTGGPAFFLLLCTKALEEVCNMSQLKTGHTDATTAQALRSGSSNKLTRG